jgi:hypothetical protein
MAARNRSRSWNRAVGKGADFRFESDRPRSRIAWTIQRLVQRDLGSAKQRERTKGRRLLLPSAVPPGASLHLLIYPHSLHLTDMWGLHLWARLMLPSDSHRTGRRVNFFSIYILLDKSRMGCCGSLVILFQKLKPLNSSFF